MGWDGIRRRWFRVDWVSRGRCLSMFSCAMTRDVLRCKIRTRRRAADAIVIHSILHISSRGTCTPKSSCTHGTRSVASIAAIHIKSLAATQPPNPGHRPPTPAPLSRPCPKAPPSPPDRLLRVPSSRPRLPRSSRSRAPHTAGSAPPSPSPRNNPTHRAAASSDA